MSTARKGKIARCPLAIREEVNRRLLNGDSGPKILAWLNSDESVLRVLDEHFSEEPVTPQNLSEWRQGGYQEWLDRRDKVEHTKSLATFAAQMGQAAGGDLTDGSAAILGGKILEALESATPDTDLAKLTKSLVMLRATDLEARKGKQRERLLSQKEREISLKEKQFEIRTCELFMKFYADKKAKEIIEGKAAAPVKMEELRQLMFPMDEPLHPKPLN
jgi:hypothetical protein